MRLRSMQTRWVAFISIFKPLFCFLPTYLFLLEGLWLVSEIIWWGLLHGIFLFKHYKSWLLKTEIINLFKIDRMNLSLLLLELNFHKVWKLITVTIFKWLQIFFLQGRIIFGPDVRSLFLTVFLIVTPVLIFCALVARKLMDDFNKHLGVCIMVFVVFITLVVSIFYFKF